MSGTFWNRLRLNARALRLGLSGFWLTENDVAQSYNLLAEDYDENWLVHLRSSTDRLHEFASKIRPEADRVLELGCGSGYCTQWIGKTYPKCELLAVDISPGMIEKAKRRLAGERLEPEFRCGDMLQELKRQSGGTLDLIFSAWAIGYSQPAAIIAESSRALREGGILAVIVNRLDTLPAVFLLYREAMRRFPESLRKALWPRFPKDQTAISTMLHKHRFRIEHIEQGSVPIRIPPENRLRWLLGTGVLAGFDRALPLREPGPVRDWFAEKLDQIGDDWEHHYILFLARKEK